MLQAYGIDADGALLIRPDGFIAWRRRNASGLAPSELDAALERVLASRTAQSGRETKVAVRRGGRES